MIVLRRLVLVLAVTVVLAGCGIQGKIFIAFLGDTGGTLTSFTCNAPLTPNTVAGLTLGAYYLTLAGNYTVTYNYGGLPVSLPIKLEAEQTVLGQEDAYYHVYLSLAGTPTIEKFPSVAR